MNPILVGTLVFIVWLAAIAATSPDTHNTCQAQEAITYDVCTLELTK